MVLTIESQETDAYDFREILTEGVKIRVNSVLDAERLRADAETENATDNSEGGTDDTNNSDDWANAEDTGNEDNNEDVESNDEDNNENNNENNNESDLDEDEDNNEAENEFEDLDNEDEENNEDEADSEAENEEDNDYDEFADMEEENEYNEFEDSDDSEDAENEEDNDYDEFEDLANNSGGDNSNEVDNNEVEDADNNDNDLDYFSNNEGDESEESAGTVATSPNTQPAYGAEIGKGLGVQGEREVTTSDILARSAVENQLKPTVAEPVAVKKETKESNGEVVLTAGMSLIEFLTVNRQVRTVAEIKNYFKGNVIQDALDDGIIVEKKGRVIF